MKILFFDVETTGLDAKKQDIIQIAGIVEIDGEVKEEFNFTCQPFSYANIEQRALDVHGRGVEELKTYQPPQEMYQKLIKIFDKYIDRYNKDDKFIPAGYNVSFDVNFLFEFFKKNDNPYCGAYLDHHKLDPMPVLIMLDLKGTLKLNSYKLANIANDFGIEISAHDAMSDIRATREVCQKVMEHLK